MQNSRWKSRLVCISCYQPAPPFCLALLYRLLICAVRHFVGFLLISHPILLFNCKHKQLQSRVIKLHPFCPTAIDGIFCWRWMLNRLIKKCTTKDKSSGCAAFVGDKCNRHSCYMQHHRYRKRCGRVSIAASPAGFYSCSKTFHFNFLCYFQRNCFRSWVNLPAQTHTQSYIYTCIHACIHTYILI